MTRTPGTTELLTESGQELRHPDGSGGHNGLGLAAADVGPKSDVEAELDHVRADGAQPVNGWAKRPRLLKNDAVSWATNVLLSVDVSEDSALVHEFDRWLQILAPRQGQLEVKGVGSLRALHDSPEAWGGVKHPEALLWAGVLNKADVAAVVQRFGAIDWRLPHLAQLLIQDQEQGAFRVWMIRDGGVRQYAPLPDFDADE